MKKGFSIEIYYPGAFVFMLIYNKILSVQIRDAFIRVYDIGGAITYTVKGYDPDGEYFEKAVNDFELFENKEELIKTL